MCGIGGTVSPYFDHGPLIPLILEDQRNRGPDYSKSLVLDQGSLRVLLAHNRLAILDLSENSHQPFIDPKTGACLVFNGEIYNYLELRRELQVAGEHFTTSGDTEVLLKAFLHWGGACFGRLQGMFAFAVWDPRTKKLTVARDRFGVKPFHYFYQPDIFAFASNLGALAEHFSLRPNLEYLARGVALQLYENQQDILPYEGLHSLPPGHYLELANNRINIRRYYDLSSAVACETEILQSLDENKTMLRLEERLRNAVRLRMRTDVPLTLSLSGGLDSALLASFIVEQGHHVFEAFNFGSADEQGTEGPAAQAVAERLGLKLNFVQIAPNQICETFEKTLDAQGEPFGNLSVLAQYAIYEKMRTAGYKVSIGGQGADEAFMGYRKFQLFNFQAALRERAWARMPDAAGSLAKMLLWHWRDLGEVRRSGQRYFGKRKHKTPFKNLNNQLFSVGFSDFTSLLERRQAELGFASLSTLLRYEDRNSMGNSIENRLPFLDHHVVETGLALPAEQNIRSGYGKWILRRLGKNRLPRSVTSNQIKLGFQFDPKKWLQMGLGKHLYQGVQRYMPLLSDIMSPDALRTLKEEQSFYKSKNIPLLVTAFWVGSRI